MSVTGGAAANEPLAADNAMLCLPFRAQVCVGGTIFPSSPREVPNSLTLLRCLGGLSGFCLVFCSYLPPLAYDSGKSVRK